MIAVVQFSGQNFPTLFALTHSSDGEKLLTMDNVEWVQVISDGGYVIDRTDVFSNFAPMRPEVKASAAPPVTPPGWSNPSQIPACVREMLAGNKICAIKEYRQATHSSLLEAKKAVENYWYAVTGADYGSPRPY